MLATDERGQARPVERLEAAFRRAFTEHSPSRYRSSKTLQRVEAEFGEIEQTAYQLPGSGCYHHSSWLGDTL